MSMYKRFIAAATLCLFAASCNDPNDIQTLEPIRADAVAVIVADATYGAANLELIMTDDHSVHNNLLPGLHPYHALRTHGGDVYILENFNRDNVIKYSPSRAMYPVYQRSVGTGLNIQDIAIVNDTKAYISALQSSDIIVFNPATGEVLSTVDISQFNSFAGTDDETQYPFAASLIYHNKILYAACQRLGNDWDVGDMSLIVMIDVDTDDIIGMITLNKKNPARMSRFENMMLVASQGSWQDIGGEYAGIEMIDLAANENLGVIINGAALGGNPMDVIFVADSLAYARVMLSDFSTVVIPFDPTSRTVHPHIDGIIDVSGGMAYDGSKIYVGDRGLGASGVVVIDPTTNAIVQRIETSMPPSAIGFVSVR